MAASAPSPLVSSTEKTNGAKLSRLLIDGGTTVLKIVFDSHHSPANLAMDLTANRPKLCNLLKRRVLHKPQWDKLFPPSGSTPDSNNFDITLLFLLLTEICGLSPPPSGWHKKPPLSDTTLEANLARIKFFRNELYGHVSTTGIDSSTFSHLWREISDVLVALGLNKADVDRLKAEYCGEEDYLQMLCEWADSEKDLKSQLKEINQTIDMVHQNQTQGAEMLQQMKSELHGACHTQTKIQEEVLEVKKSIEDFNQRGQANRTEEILNVLAKFEFNGEIEFHVSRFQEGTREWIFKKIEGWLDDRSSPNRVMVISGNAGVGKSVISAVTCKRMQQAGRLLGSHFFQYNNSRYRNPQLMLQSLASHLCRALPEYKEALFDQLSRNLCIEINSMGVKELFALLFKEPLSKITDPRRNLLLVIDALDESEYKGRNELLDVIANHFIKLPQWIRFLVTTRPEVDISNSLSDLQPLYLETNDDDNRRDIRLFLEKQLDQDVKDGRVPEATSHSKAPEEEKSLEVEEFSSRSTDQDGRQQEEAARNVDERKTVIKRGKIADESETWNLAKAGASITFNLGAITKSLTITCSLWSPTTLSPPIGSNELLVSNVIELSHDGPPDLEFMENASGSINVALLHSASNFKGYEVVIKQLVDPQYNEWEDLETKNIWHSSVHPTVPNWTCPSVETSCSKRWFSSFAAVWRLKSFVFPKPMSKTSEFICSLPDYPNVSVAIPWNSLPADTDFSLTLKVQEVPTIDHDVEGMFIGPILHISCSNNVKLSAPAKIPLALTDGEIEPAELHSGQVKILHFNSREESQDWTDITDHLDMPVVLRDGIVTFQVKTFCKFWLWLLKTSTSIPWKLVRILPRGFMPEHVGFLACLCDDAVSSRYLLKMFCFPQHLGSGLNSDISSRYSVNMQGEGTSQKPLSCGDETYVSLSNGFEVHGKGNVEDIVLKFLGHDPFEQNLRVIIKDPGDLQVDFLKLLGDKERKNSRIICQVPIIPRSPVQHPAPVTFDFEKRIGISAQSVKHSIAKQPTVESSSCSPVAAPKKRKRQSTDLVKAGGPSNDKLEGLSQQLGEKWEELGRRLGFNQAAIENFDRDKRGLAKKAFKMLLTWKQKEGSKATNKVLYNALRHKFVKRSDLAEEFCCRKRS